MRMNENIESILFNFLSNCKKRLCTHYGPTNQEFKRERVKHVSQSKTIAHGEIKFKLAIQHKEKLIQKAICYILQQINFLFETFFLVFPQSSINLCQDGIDRYSFPRGRTSLTLNFSNACTPALVFRALPKLKVE